MAEGNNILMIEDDDFLRGLAVTKLQKSGMTVATAANGEEAIAALKKEVPDLVLLDLMLPTISGFEVLKQMKESEKWKVIKVVIFSNLGDDADILKGQQMGADDYLVKANFTLDELVEKIEKILK
jgi:DNA-binding response OmpR family regulator